MTDLVTVGVVLGFIAYAGLMCWLSLRGEWRIERDDYGDVTDKLRSLSDWEGWGQK